MIRPLPASSCARLTLLPGEPSTRSTSGSLSPTLTSAGAEAWNRRRLARQRVTGRRRAVASMVGLIGMYSSLARGGLERRRIVGGVVGGPALQAGWARIFCRAAPHWARASDPPAPPGIVAGCPKLLGTGQGSRPSSSSPWQFGGSALGTASPSRPVKRTSQTGGRRRRGRLGGRVRSPAIRQLKALAQIASQAGDRVVHGVEPPGWAFPP